MSEKPTLFQLHELTLRVLERLLHLKQGQMAPWSELTEIMGVDAQEEGRGYVNTARKIMLHEYGRVCDVIVGEGVKWLTHQEAAKLGTGYTRRVRRMARRWQRKAQTVDLKQLNQQELKAALDQQVRAGFLLQSTTMWNKPRQRPATNGGNPGVGFQMG